MQIATRGVPLKDVHRKPLRRRGAGNWQNYALERSRAHPSTVRHESPSQWVFKSKDVLESQDEALEIDVVLIRRKLHRHGEITVEVDFQLRYLSLDFSSVFLATSKISFYWLQLYLEEI